MHKNEPTFEGVVKMCSFIRDGFRIKILHEFPLSAKNFIFEEMKHGIHTRGEIGMFRKC